MALGSCSWISQNSEKIVSPSLLLISDGYVTMRKTHKWLKQLQSSFDALMALMASIKHMLLIWCLYGSGRRLLILLLLLFSGKNSMMYEKK